MLLAILRAAITCQKLETEGSQEFNWGPGRSEAHPPPPKPRGKVIWKVGDARHWGSHWVRWQAHQADPFLPAASPCPTQGEKCRNAESLQRCPPSLSISVSRAPPGEKMKCPTRSPAPYISVRCRRADSSLGTAVKWFPSRYLEKRCRMNPGRQDTHGRVFRDAFPGFPD